MSRKIVLFVIIAIVISGCAATPEEAMPPDTPTPKPIPTNTPTPEPKPTDIPIPEPATLEEISVIFDNETLILEEIIIVFKNLFPGGIEYDENGERFLLGSMSQRTIFQVLDDGTFEPFNEDPDLSGCRALEIDRINQRLLVANNNEGEGKSYLNAYDLSSGDRIFRANHTGKPIQYILGYT